MDQYWYVQSLVNANLLTSFWIDQYWHVQSLVNVNLFTLPWINQYWHVRHLAIANLLTSHWMDQHWRVQGLVNANLFRSLDITLNRPILICSKSRQRKSFDITLSRSILLRSKSCQCKSLQISWHHFEWTNIDRFKISPIQISLDILASLWMDQYWRVRSCVEANLFEYLDIASNWPMFKVSSMLNFWRNFKRTNYWQVQNKSPTLLILCWTIKYLRITYFAILSKLLLINCLIQKAHFIIRKWTADEMAKKTLLLFQQNPRDFDIKKRTKFFWFFTFFKLSKNSSKKSNFERVEIPGFLVRKGVKMGL